MSHVSLARVYPIFGHGPQEDNIFKCGLIMGHEERWVGFDGLRFIVVTVILSSREARSSAWDSEGHRAYLVNLNTEGFLTWHPLSPFQGWRFGGHGRMNLIAQEKFPTMFLDHRASASPVPSSSNPLLSPSPRQSSMGHVAHQACVKQPSLGSRLSSPEFQQRSCMESQALAPLPPRSGCASSAPEETPYSMLKNFWAVQSQPLCRQGDLCSAWSTE